MKHRRATAADTKESVVFMLSKVFVWSVLSEMRFGVQKKSLVYAGLYAADFFSVLPVYRYVVAVLRVRLRESLRHSA